MANNSIFNTVSLMKPKRAKFDLSHERKMTIPFGALVPTLVQEVLPGDSFDVNANVLARFQSMLSPMMHRVNVYTHYFYVSNRVLTRNWMRFISYQGNRPNLSQANTSSPFFTYSSARSAVTNGVAGNALKDGSLLDYLGFPTAPNDVSILNSLAWLNSTRFSAILPLAYQRIWNDFYRDENYTQPLFSNDGTSQADPVAGSNWFDNIVDFNNTGMIDPESVSAALTSTVCRELLTLRWRAWEKDYLTSATPYANQSTADVRVPIVVPQGSLGTIGAGGSPNPSANSFIGETGGIQYPGSSGNPSDQGSFTISALRVASSLKRWLENTARGGSRYVSGLWNHWMVSHSDKSMWEAMYLGGGMQPMVISEVVTTAPATPTQTNVPAGYLAGHGISYGSSNRFKKRFEEHGVVMGITSVIPRTSYLYSLPRAFMRSEPLDFAWPEFAQIGEQGVLGAEVFFKLETGASLSAPNYTAAVPSQQYSGVVVRFPTGFTPGGSYFGFDLQNDNPEGSGGLIWGYQGRYAEYKYQQDTVHGLFRNSQSFWHFGRMLSPSPLLSTAFVTSNPRMDGFAVLPNNGHTGQYNQHPILLQVYNRVSVVRSLPYYNTPTLW